MVTVTAQFVYKFNFVSILAGNGNRHPLFGERTHKIRILGTSFSDAVVNGVCSKLLTLKVKAENDYLPGSEVEFLDIIFAERNLTAHVFDGTCVEYLEQSSIYELMGETRIYVENGNIIVDTPIAGDVQLIAVDGRMVEYLSSISMVKHLK